MHIADPTAAAIQAHDLATIGLLGTRFTTEHDFYIGRLRERYGLRVIVPDAADRATVHRVIYDELCLGVIRPAAKSEYLQIMERLVVAGAEGIF